MMNLAAVRGAKLGLALVAALSMAACARTANDLGANGGVAGQATPGSTQDFTANVGDRVFFAQDSSQLSPTATATLEKQASWLARYPNYSFTVEGHADERGTREYNFALGARRAAVTKQYLASRGVAASRMRTISYGKERPIATCNDESCWNQNRRAVTVLTGAGS